MAVLAQLDSAGSGETVNCHDSIHDTSACLLASGSIIKNAGTWPALKAAAQTFR